MITISNLVGCSTGTSAALENFIHVGRCAAIQVRIAYSIADQSADIYELAGAIDRRQPILHRKVDDALSICQRDSIYHHDACVGAARAGVIERGPECVRLAQIEKLRLDTQGACRCLDPGPVTSNRVVARIGENRDRASPGTISLISSSRFGANSPTIALSPVIFPAGRERLVTRPVPRGSPLAAITTGTVEVAFLAAFAAGVPLVTMTSTFRARSSRANPGKRSSRPSAERYSMTRFCPSKYPERS